MRKFLSILSLLLSVAVVAGAVALTMAATNGAAITTLAIIGAFALVCLVFALEEVVKVLSATRVNLIKADLIVVECPVMEGIPISWDLSPLGAQAPVMWESMCTECGDRTPVQDGMCRPCMNFEVAMMAMDDVEGEFNPYI